MIYYLNFVAVSLHAKYLYCFIYPPLNGLKIQYLSYITFKKTFLQIQPIKNTQENI